MSTTVAGHERLPFSSLDPDALETRLRQLGLGLTTGEARRLVALLGRDPTPVEARLFDTMWSEHCSYKSSRPVLRRFPTTGTEVVLGPGEDAGVVRLGVHEGETHCLVIAHESHNHPSQVMPIEGAATGVGGIVRDVYCMGAEVIGVLDALRFGDPTGPRATRVRDIAGGVVEGIMEYGNALGVPNLGGDVFLHRGYDENCLVNVVALGICAESRLIRSRVPESGRGPDPLPHVLILIGKPTDATGFGGAAFASAILDADHEEAQKGAVQVPDPFLKRVLFEATDRVWELARDRGHQVGCKDLGAGGISCAAVELAAAAGVGIEIDLSRVSVDQPGHPPEVIACAETQERFALVVPAVLAEEVIRIYERDFELPALYPGAGARVVGKVLPEDRFVLRDRERIVCDVPASVVTAGIAVERVEGPPRPSPPPAPVDFDFDPPALLLEMIGRPNVASRAPIYRGYDLEVRGRAVIRPGEGDAGVVLPLAGADFGVAVSVDGIPTYGEIDGYLAGAHATYEAMRNVVAVGAEPLALTDCLNFGSPEDPGVFRAFTAAVDGIADAARRLGTRAGEPVPVVSGNVSFYNQSSTGSAIPASPIVACAGRLSTIAHATTMRVKRPGSTLLVIGARSTELGGSEVLATLGGEVVQALPPIDFETARAELYATLELVEEGWVLACHDISTGGLLTAIVEMLLGESSSPALGAVLSLGTIGWRRDPARTPSGWRRAALLFGETPGFVLEVAPEDLEPAHARLAGLGVTGFSIGRVIGEPRLDVHTPEGDFSTDLESLATRRLAGLAEVLA